VSDWESVFKPYLITEEDSRGVIMPMSLDAATSGYLDTYENEWDRDSDFYAQLAERALSDDSSSEDFSHQEKAIDESENVYTASTLRQSLVLCKPAALLQSFTCHEKLEHPVASELKGHSITTSGMMHLGLLGSPSGFCLS